MFVHADQFHLEALKQPIELLSHSVGMFTAFTWKNAFLRLADYFSDLPNDANSHALRVFARLGLALLMIIALAVVGGLLNPWLDARIAHAVTNRQQRVYEAQKTLLYTHLGVAMAAFLASALEALFAYPVRSASTRKRRLAGPWGPHDVLSRTCMPAVD